MDNLEKCGEDLYEGLVGEGSTPEQARDMIARYNAEVRSQVLREPVFGWVDLLDPEDRRECLTELAGLLKAGLLQSRTVGGNQLALLDEAVYAWRATAKQLQDPERRAVLLAPRQQSGQN